MRKIFLVLSFYAIGNGVSAQKLIKHQKTFSISASQVRIDDSTIFNLSKPEGALAFVREKILQDQTIKDDKVSSSLFSPFIQDELEQAVIIFIRHGLDPTALTTNLSSKNLAELRKEEDKVINDNLSLSDSVERIESSLTLLRFKSQLADVDYDAIVGLLPKSTQDVLFRERAAIRRNPDLSKLLTTGLVEQKDRIQKVINDNDKKSERSKPSFVETKEIVKTVLHKKGGRFSDYLLETRKVLLILLGGAEDLQKAEVSIVNNKSFFNQSFEDLRAAIPLIKSASSKELPCKVILLEPSKINPPSQILIKDASFEEDIVFTIHERNSASFQIGVINNQFRLNNFAITNGNLVVKPDTTQRKNWKSNLYASLELHIPRDIDNFTPIYKTIFKGTDSNRTVGRWIYDVTLSRMGIYGGLRISDDPFSNIHAGFNYAISKELYVNFGWTWTNEIVPQVTAIGEVSSLSDAVKYAKRKYSSGQFSWGLSFAPSTLIETLGLKSKDKENTADKK